MIDQRLRNGEAVKFNHAYANHTHSNPSVSLMLTEANQYNGKHWSRSASLFNYFSAAKVESEWLTNHRLLSGWSNQITSIARESDRIKTINLTVGYGNPSSGYDGELIPLFENSVEQRPNQVTFLHFYNSHIGYCNRYPSEQAHFQPLVPAHMFGDLNTIRVFKASTLACYDNSILYTDSLLEKLIRKLEARKNPSILLYTADHSEEVIGGKAHNSALFTYDMINIPLIVWANTQWRQKHPDLWANLINNRNRVFTNDMLFESILGLTGIEAPSLDKQFDISSTAFTTPSKAKTLHGSRYVDDSENWHYWQLNNSILATQKRQKLGFLGGKTLGDIHAALELGISTLLISAMLDNGEWYVADQASGEKISKLSTLFESIDSSRIDQLSLGLLADTKIPTRYLEKLDSLNNISIKQYQVKRRDTLALDDPEFEIKLDKITPTIEPVWVTIRTRYATSAADIK
jgi:hypothetical protein